MRSDSFQFILPGLSSLIVSVSVKDCYSIDLPFTNFLLSKMIAICSSAALISLAEQEYNGVTGSDDDGV